MLLHGKSNMSLSLPNLFGLKLDGCWIAQETAPPQVPLASLAAQFASQAGSSRDAVFVSPDFGDTAAFKPQVLL